MKADRLNICRELSELVADDTEKMYTTPVILLQDVNHGIYATGMTNET